MARHSILEIHNDALAFNYDLMASFLLEDQKVMAVVKANGYGSGAVNAAKVFLERGAAYLAVACIQEAAELREAGISAPILVLSPFFEKEVPLYLHYDISATVVDVHRAAYLDEMARQAGKTVPVHFKMDTGMGRLGPRWEDAPSMILEITGLKNVSLEGLFSHFPSADLLDDFSLEQIERFKNVAKAVEEKKVFIPFKHISNSSGIIAYNDPYFNLVRPGIVLYGTAPSAVMEERILPRPVFHWKTRILEIKNFKPGDTVSYGRTYTVKEPTRAAVIPLGYADGFLTLNSNNGTVIIGEKPCAILGRVCMDYFVVDLKNVPEAEVEDEVSVYGDFDEIRPMDIAKRTGLIPYEILTNVNQSTPRIYLKGE